MCISTSIWEVYIQQSYGGFVCNSTGMWAVFVPVVWRLCVNFHRHVKSVCSTVVWRACVHFHSHVGSVSFQLCAWFAYILQACEYAFPVSCGGFVGIFHSTSNFSTCKLHYMYIYTLLVYIICTRKRFSVL